MPLLHDQEPWPLACAAVALRSLGSKDHARALKRAAVERSAGLGKIFIPADWPLNGPDRNATLAEAVDETLRGWGIDPESMKD
jgi:hypothetical protein